MNPLRLSASAGQEERSSRYESGVDTPLELFVSELLVEEISAGDLHARRTYGRVNDVARPHR